MSTNTGITTYVTKGMGEWAQKELHYSQAIRVGDIIYVSGQGGWNREDVSIPTDLNTEIDQAFANVEHTLKHAGGKGWPQVFRVRTYHTDIQASHARIVENYRRYTPDLCPTWTEIGVRELGLGTMHIEIEVEAYDPEGAAAEAAARKEEGGGA